MSELISSPRFARRASWVAGLIFLAGVVAFGVTYFGGKDETPAAVTPAQGQAAPPPTSEPVQKTVPVSGDAKLIAGQFILSAVTRTDMAKAWKLTDPTSEIRQCSGRPCTYKEWLTGDVPIQPFPKSALGTVSYAVNESNADRVVLEVVLLPKDGADIRGQYFYIGLKSSGAGKQKRWLVDYWAPRAINPVPNAGEN